MSGTTDQFMRTEVNTEGVHGNRRVFTNATMNRTPSRASGTAACASMAEMRA